MITLTNEESSIVQLKAKSTTDSLPQYYSAESKTNVSISRDFEAFLILQGSANLQEAISWINRSTALNESNSDRDALMTESITYEQNDVKNQLSELYDKLGDFNTFRAKFQAGKFAGVGEVALILRDIQFGIGELSELQNRLEHLDNLLLYITRTVVGMTQDQMKELKSWVTPIREYM